MAKSLQRAVIRPDQILPWLAEALVMRLCLLFSAQKEADMYLDPSQTYADNEDRFKTFVFAVVCRDEEELCKEYMFTFLLKVSRDGSLVDVEHQHYGGHDEYIK